MKRAEVIIGLTVCVLAAGTAWAAKAGKPAPAAEEEPKKDEKPVSPFSWELYGQLPPNSPLAGCRIIRTEPEWLAMRKALGAAGFPVSFSRNMLLVCALRQDLAQSLRFVTLPEVIAGRLEAVMSVQPVPPPAPPKEGEPPAPPAPASPLRFHLIEVLKYEGPVRVTFELSGEHDPSQFQPVEILAAQ